MTAQGPAACYVCRLADVPGKFQPGKVSIEISEMWLNWVRLQNQAS